MTTTTGLYQLSTDQHTDWRNSALCGQVDPELFYPTAGGSTRLAKQICQECSVRTECLDDAFNLPPSEDNYGIRGGLSARERSHIRSHHTSRVAAVKDKAA